MYTLSYFFAICTSFFLLADKTNFTSSKLFLFEKGTLLALGESCQTHFLLHNVNHDAYKYLSNQLSPY